MRLMTWVTFVFLIACSVRPSAAIDFQTVGALAVTDILDQCARIGNFSVVVDPAVRGLTLRVNMKDVTPEELVVHVARSCSLQARRYVTPGFSDIVLVTPSSAALPPHLPAPPAGAPSVALNIPQETPLPVIAEMLGKMGGFDVLVQPELAAIKRVVHVNGVPAATVLNALAAASGLTVELLPKQSGRPTYLVKQTTAVR